MNKNRYLLCLLVTGFMLYYGIPKISFDAPGGESIFAATWLAFAFLVVAGNLSAFLYTPRKQKVVQKKVDREPKNNRGYAN